MRRHLLFALLIALLPLRAWMGDAMAVSMMPAGPPAHAPMAMVQQPCPDHTAAATATTGHDQAGPAADAGHQHPSCDVCNGPAMAQAAPADTARPLQRGLLASPAEHFASSEPRRGVKPPIS